LDAIKGNGHDEVAEAVSPGGHVTKRRARSRPVSLELLESAKSPTSPQVMPIHSRPATVLTVTVLVCHKRISRR
jgi:mitosis inhibitor protein kinase SWE1